MQHILACWIHGSLMMLTVNSFVALMFWTVSLSVDEDEKDMTGGEADTCGYTDDLLFKIVLRAGLYANLIKPAVDKKIKNSISYASTLCLSNHLNGARFSVPSSDIEETKATGRGAIPEIKIAYNCLLFQSMSLSRGQARY